MGLRLRCRVRLAPDLRVNVSRSSISWSVGGEGLWLTSGPRGRRATVGWPGTGLFLTQQFRDGAAPHQGRSLGWIIFWLAALIAIAVFCLVAAHAHAADSDPVTFPPGLPDDLICKSPEPYSPCVAGHALAAELWNYAPQYRSACVNETTYPNMVDCLSRHIWGVPFGARKHYVPPSSD